MIRVLQILSAEFRALTTLHQENIQFAFTNCLEFAPGKLILKKLKNLVLIHCLDDKLEFKNRERECAEKIIRISKACLLTA